MPFTYRRLRGILKEKGLTKTEFRSTADISTATLAKLSADEPVALPILEKICQALNCQIEDVIEITPKCSNSRWRRVSGNENYVVHLLWLTERTLDKNNIERSPSISFLYGYAIACGDETERRSYCETDKICNNNMLDTWTLTLIISGAELLDLIRCMEQKQKVDEFLRQHELHLSNPPRKSDKWIVDVFSNAIFFSEDMNYRPEILLLPKTESCNLSPAYQPIHSQDDDPLFCEAFIPAEITSIYSNEDGSLNLNRMDIIREAFKKEGLLINGNKDMVRIGSFEVLSRMKEGVPQSDLFSVDSILDEQNPHSRCIVGFRITVFQKHLKGNYCLEVRTYNAGNITADKVFLVKIDGKDILRQIDLNESSGYVEVRLFEIGTGDRIELIGYKTLSMMRDIILNMNVIESQGRLIDKYTKSRKKANNKVERYTSNEINISDKGNDPWRKQYSRVYDDYENIYGCEYAESMFFSNDLSVDGSYAHEEFLIWMKKKINGSNADKVYLWDPYIDSESITRIIRMIENTQVQYTIVTDAHAPSHGINRIENIKTVCGGLDVFLPSRIQVVAFSKGDAPVLHDRFLFIVGEKYLPEVYCLSNSLDNMGSKTPSVVSKLDKVTAHKVVEYYFEQLRKSEEADQIEIIWNSSTRRPTERYRPSDINVTESLNKVVSPFNTILSKNGIGTITVNRNGIELWPEGTSIEVQKKAIKLICSNAYIYWTEFAYIYANIRIDRQALFDGLADAYNDRLEKRLTECMTEFIEDMINDADLPENRILRVSHRAESVSEFRELLQALSVRLDNPRYHFGLRKIKEETRLAAKMLLHCNFSIFENIFDKVYNNSSKVSLERVDALSQMLALELNISSDDKQLKLAESCIKSESLYLIAMGIQWFVKRQKECPEIIAKATRILGGDEYSQEMFREAVIRNQIHIVRTRNAEISDTDILGKTKELWAKWLPEKLTYDQMRCLFDGLTVRNANDTCDMILKAVEFNKTTAEDAKRYLLDCLTDKIDTYVKSEKGNWVNKDARDGEIFLDALIMIGEESGICEFLKRLSAKEKKLVKELHDVFLHAKDYTKWKCYIDSLIWCCIMRLLCKLKVKNYEEIIKNDTNLQTRQHDIDNILKKHASALSEYSEIYKVWHQLTENSRVYEEKDNGTAQIPQ